MSTNVVSCEEESEFRLNSIWAL